MNQNFNDINQIIEAMDIVYTFVISNYDNYTQPHDYGNGVEMNMVEIHTLSLIADHPGILISGVAKMWNRTPSAASQNVNKLVKKGLVVKKKENGNKKSIHLYVTDEGKWLSDRHKEYDKKELYTLAENLIHIHTIEELETTLSVMNTGLELLKSSQR